MVLIIFPLLTFSHWRCEDSQKLFVFHEESLGKKYFLRNLLPESRSFRTTLEDVVRSILYFRPKAKCLHQDSTKRSKMEEKLNNKEIDRLSMAWAKIIETKTTLRLEGIVITL